MPRGENPAFKERVGKLSLPLKHKNVESKIRAVYSTKVLDHLDTKAYITSDETFSEIWHSIEEQLEAVSQGYENYGPSDVQGEKEKYQHLADKHEEIIFISE